MDSHYYVGHLGDLIHSYKNEGIIAFHVDGIKLKYLQGELKIEKYNEKVFYRILKKMLKYNEGYWEEENIEFEILFYSLKYLLKDS